ncbi:formylglycine-generating enzyme family protein [Sessilibacter corallicola]|uniref:formylglycine-generating enzyme family protein n=1 Tax=Sessilibacter corallicola TaxID=2904075 RepID=UPI001E57C868|nr:formylglycine-generating enzyme family protein [Sessilibacter corallicola]MCE2029332.1 formylglycine-generating enzyme family protein [Sessilibacter corallicola]
MTDYAAVLELINQVGEDHSQLPFMLKALGVEKPDEFIANIKSKQDIIPPPEFAPKIQEALVDQEQTSYLVEESGEAQDREKPPWSFPIVVVESYELHDVEDQTQQEKPEHEIKPLDNEPVSTDELLQQDARNTPSLWSKQAVKNGLHQFLEHVQNHQQLDIPKLAVQMAQKQPIGELPFLQTHKLPAELWLYVDKTHSGYCFHDTYVELYRNLQTYVGPLGIAQTVELLPNSKHRMVSAKQVNQCHWRKSAKFDEYFEYITEYSELPMPESGSSVIICAPKKVLVETAANFWNEFSQKLHQQRITVLFVPLSFTQANTNLSTIAALSIENENQQKEFLWAALSLIPHRLSLAIIRNLRTEFTQLGPDFELEIINHTNVNWWHSQNVGCWFEGVVDYQEQINQCFNEFATLNSKYSNGVELLNTVCQTIESNIPKKLTSFIIEFKVLVLLHAQDLLTDHKKQTLESEVTTYYQQSIASIEKAQAEAETQNNNKNIIDETQFWLSQALRLNIADFDSAVIPDALKTVVTSAKHHWQQATQQQVPEIPVLDDDYYRRLNKDVINNNQGGALVLAKQSTILPKTTENSHPTVTLEIISQQELDANPTINTQVIANVKNTNIYSGSVSNINGKQQIKLAVGSTHTLKTLKETITLKTYNSNDFYWAKSIQQTPQGVKATAEQFEIQWRNPNPSDGLLLRDLFEVIVYDNAPQWLNDFPPQLDKYGVFSKITVGNVSFKMRYIPPGSFLMGSPEDESERHESEHQHPVHLTSGFWLAETTVTQLLWLVIMGKIKSSYIPPNVNENADDSENLSLIEEANLPIDSINWNDCNSFFKKLKKFISGANLTFPTEAQWEYACRAGTKSAFYFGGNITATQFNYNGAFPYTGFRVEKHMGKIAQVLQFAPNDWGLFQMHGNLNEWCLDGFRKYPEVEEGIIKNPLGGFDNKQAILRGGHWRAPAGECRSASRGGLDHDSSYDGIGVRLCIPITDHSEN